MKQNPHVAKISVCLPTFNRADYLKESIRSVLGQTYGDFEFLIMNDGSTDSTEQIVLGFTDPRICYVQNKKNLGYVPSLDRCARLAKGEWVMFMSDDDLLLPTALERMVEVLGKIRDPKSEIQKEGQEKVGMVVPQTILVDAGGKVISRPKLQLQGQGHLRLHPGEFIFNYTLYGWKLRDKYRFNTSFPSTLFNRKIFLQERSGSKDVLVAHDLLIGAKIALKYPVLVVDEPLIKYRVHENWGSSLNREGKFLDEYLRYLGLLFEFVEEEKIQFGYDFKKYCHDALVKYLFQLDGGLLRLAVRYEGPYHCRLRKIIDYLQFSLREKPLLLLWPQLYLSLTLSLLPREILLLGSSQALSIFRSRP